MNPGWLPGIVDGGWKPAGRDIKLAESAVRKLERREKHVKRNDCKTSYKYTTKIRLSV